MTPSLGAAGERYGKLMGRNAAHGWSAGDKVSLHYFESPSGQVFNFKVKPGWSNQ